MKKSDSIRQRRLAKKLAAGMPKGRAAVEAGYAPKSASSQVSDLLRNPKFRSILDEELEKIGVTDEYLARKHKQLLEAKKTVSAVSGKDADSGTVDFIEVDDHQVQAKALDMMYKRKGDYIEKQEITHSGNITINVIDYSKMVKKP